MAAMTVRGAFVTHVGLAFVRAVIATRLCFAGAGLMSALHRRRSNSKLWRNDAAKFRASPLPLLRSPSLLNRLGLFALELFEIGNFCRKGPRRYLRAV